MYNIERKPINRHSSPRLLGLQCDRCPCMCVMQRRRLRVDYEEYYCDHMKMVIDPWTVECTHPKEFKLYQPKFNRYK